MDFSPLYSWLPLLLVVLLILFFKLKKKGENNKKLNLPPSPPGLPILGNLHQLSDLIPQSYHELSKKYGPVMLLHLGRIPNVVVSSAEAAREVLKVQDLVCCSRPILASAGRLTYNHKDMAFTPYGDHWRNIRKIGVLELFSVKRVQSFQYIRDEETEVLLKSLFEAASSATPVNISDMMFALTANITFKMSFGIFDYRGTDFDSNGFHEIVHDASAVTGSFSAAEYFPYFGWIIDRLNGHHARTERVFHQLDRFFQHVINEHMKPGRKKDHPDVIDVLLAVENEQSGGQLNLDNVKGILLNLFLGGVDTAAITLNWAMAELIRHPRIMKKVQDEIRNHVGKRERVTDDDFEHLHYMKLVVKEALRVHPPVPLLVPRETMSLVKIGGYDIPPKTMIQINAWALSRDSKYWKDPEEFIPERFENSSVDYKGMNFEYLPFGGGRRICPGITMGIMTIETALANLLLCFDWKLPDGTKIEDVNMDDLAGVSLTITKKEPLILVPVKYQA